MSHFKKRLNEALDNIEESPAAPAPTRQPTPTRQPGKPTTRPSRPAKPAKPKPFNPPRPKVVPAPKNKYLNQEDQVPESVEESLMREAFEDETHPSNTEFWGNVRSNPSHPFAKHPIMAMYGDELGRASWQHTRDRAREVGVNTARNQNAIMQIMQRVVQIEAQHRDELIDLAKRITTTIWGIPEEQLQGNLGMDAGMEANEAGDEEYDLGHDERTTAELKDQIDKRMTINTLTQGSAVNAMLTMHHLIDKELEQIDPNLLRAYNRLSAAMHEYYWLIDIPQLLEGMGLQNMVAGSAKVDYGDVDGDGEAEPIIQASAAIFPVLAQEMSKGVAELISHHGLADMDEHTARSVLAAADDIRHEPYMIQIGPELWRRFLKVVPKGTPLSDLYAALAVQTPQEVNKIVSAAIENPELATELLRDLMHDPEEFDVEGELDYLGQDDEYGDHGNDNDDEENWDVGRPSY